MAEEFFLPKLIHATQHGVGQPDALELDGSQIKTGLVPTARLGSGAPGAGRVLMNGAWVVLDTAAVSGLSSALAGKADAAAVSSALAGKVSIPSGVATPGYVVAVKQGGGYEHVPAPSGGSGGSGGSSPEVEQITLTEDLTYALPAGVAPNRVHSVVFTQDATGGHMVTHGGVVLDVDPAPGVVTALELWPSGAGFTARRPAAADVATFAFSASQPIVGGVIVAATTTGPMTWSDGPPDVWLGRVRSALIDQTLTLGVRVWGSAVAFQLYTRSTYATTQVRVNGRLITPRAGTEIPNSSVDGAVWVHVTFAGAGPHDVQVTGQTIYHMAVAHEADGSIAPSTLPTSTARMIVLGDSWIGGALDVPAHATIPSALGDALGLDVWGAGQGGTGYVATGPGADGWTQDFGDSRRLAPIIAAKPTDVVVLGSVNDNSAAFSAIRAAAEATFAALVAALPTVRLHVVLPQPTTVAAESDAAKLANRAAVRAAAEASTRMFTIVDGGAAGWITAGNQARFIGIDNVHPTQEGHDYVAALIAEKIRPALMPGAAPLPVVYASDSFTRADGAVGSTEGGSLTWTTLVDNAWSILSGQLKPPAVIGDTGRGAKLVVDVGQTDFAAQVDCSGGNWGIGLLFRAKADGSGYVLIHNSNTVELRNLGASGAGTLIQNWYPGPATSYTLGVRCSGTTITCLRDGVPIGTVTDATHTGTRVGVRAQSSERAADNFRVAALS